MIKNTPSKKKRVRRSKEEILKDKKKEPYFGEAEEQAIKTYLSSTSELEKNRLMEKIIIPALKKLVKGIMTMPVFKKIIGIPLDVLEEEAYYHTLLQITKIKPDMIGKTGEPVKAFSYLGTICKNFLLSEKTKADKKIATHGSHLDVDEFAEVIPEREVEENELEDLRKETLNKLEKLLQNDKKLNETDIIVCKTLKYMFVNWHSINFMSKTEFMREVKYISGLDSINIAKSLKKIKPFIYEKQNIKQIKLKKTKKEVELGEGKYGLDPGLLWESLVIETVNIDNEEEV